MLPATALILVGILPAQRDLEIARLLGWYRIPLKSSPKVVDVDYLAFYQTSAFGEADRWQVKYAAQVRGHELVTRLDLFRDEPDHPRAREEYFKIQVGPLLPLPSPILAERWRRLTFLYTTGEYLNRARNLNDLVVESEERDVLWRSLRERALHAEAQSENNKSVGYQTNDLPETAVDPALLALLGALDFKISEGPIEE